MSQQNKVLVERWVEVVLNGRQFDRIPEMASNEEFGKKVQAALAALPDLRVQIVDLVAEGDRIVLVARGTATHEGPFRLIPPTGRVATMDLLAYYRIDDDKIADATVIWDVMPLLS